MVFDCVELIRSISNYAMASRTGGQFEFLPVQVSGSGTVTAILKLACHIGVNLETQPIGSFDLSSGAEVCVYVDIAEFSTHVTGAITDNGDDCKLLVDAEYTLALGAAAGATVGLNSRTWGPDLETTTPLYYATLLSVCAATKAPTISSAAPTSTSDDSFLGLSFKALAAREQSTEVTTTVTYTGVSCMVSSVNCPVSQQAT
jgi:hypothetical protein